MNSSKQRLMFLFLRTKVQELFLFHDFSWHLNCVIPFPADPCNVEREGGEGQTRERKTENKLRRTEDLTVVLKGRQIMDRRKICEPICERRRKKEGNEERERSRERKGKVKEGKRKKKMKEREGEREREKEKKDRERRKRKKKKKKKMLKVQPEKKKSW